MNSKDQGNCLAITVDVEEWFHTDFFDVEEVINKYYGGKYPRTDVVESVKKLLDLFEKHDVTATFFLLGETAERYPSLIDLVEKSVHEMACHGYYHNKDYDDLEEFKTDLKKFQKNICKDVVGFRHPVFKITQEKMKILTDLEFKYDSSIVPCRNIPGWYGNPDAPLIPYNHKLNNGKTIREFPISVSPTFRLPGGGGWYLRNAGLWWTKHVINASLKKLGYANLYIHPWELSEKNPKLKEASFHVFRNTGDKTMKSLERLISKFSSDGALFKRLDEIKE